ncbi:hypothetical protein IV102_14345 [bacterium]|nr:hypothetical protein [bacterium]
MPFGISLWVVVTTAWNPRGGWRQNRERTLRMAWGILLVMVGSACTDPAPLLYASRPWVGGGLVRAFSVALLVSYLPELRGSGKRLAGYWGGAGFAGLLTLTALAGVDAIRASPAPAIDVWTMQTEGARELWAGRNPYLTVAVSDTGPPVPGQPNIPYLYPPTQIVVTSIAYRLAGDVRYAMLAAFLLAGIGLRLMTGSSPRGFARDAPWLFLWLSPQCYFVIEQAWSEPVPLGLLVWATLAHLRGWPMGAAILFGLAASAKQTGFWLVPLAGLMLRFGAAQWTALLFSAMLPLVPFAWANFAALRHGMFDFLLCQPLRWDSLTVTNGYNLVFDAQVGGTGGFVLAALATVVAGWRMRGSAAGFATAVTFVYFVFFLFNRQAFENYYFLVAGLGALSSAAALEGNVNARET